MSDDFDQDLDLLAVASDDLALGRLAAGELPHDDPTLSLLAALRSDLDLAAAAVEAAAKPDASTKLDATVAPLRRAHRPWFAVLTAAAAVGLFAGAVVAQDRPGQVLYPVRRAILGDSGDEVTAVSSLLDRASAEISVARRTLDEDALDRADDLLDDARRRLDDVDDAFVHADLQERLTRLEADLDAAEDLLKDGPDSSGSDDSGGDSDADDSSGSGSGGDSDGDDSSGSGSSGGDSDADDSSGSGSSGSGSSGSGSSGGRSSGTGSSGRG